MSAVAYDEALAERIRDLVAGERGLTEKKMFGGLAFLVGGNMAVAASGQGGLMVRVDPEQNDELLASTKARPVVMRGREMQGWLRVDAEHVRTQPQLRRWVALGTAFARSLPAKRKARRAGSASSPAVAGPSAIPWVPPDAIRPALVGKRLSRDAGEED
jgi:TfoX/Sxy family transcriptional regulator of competence genes